jgi:hypothetical protein
MHNLFRGPRSPVQEVDDELNAEIHVRHMKPSVFACLLGSTPPDDHAP